METMKASRHVEHRRIDTISKAKRCMAVFKRLQGREQNTQTNSHSESGHEILAVAMLQRVVCPCDRTTGQQQDQRVDQRQIKWIEGGDALWRPHTTDWKQRPVKESPEKRDEEHYLGSNEQHHAIAHTDLNDRSMMPLILSLTDDVTPPHIHCHQDKGKAKAKNGNAILNFVHIHDATDSRSKGRRRPHSRPWAGFNKVIRVFVRTTHFRLL